MSARDLWASTDDPGVFKQLEDGSKGFYVIPEDVSA
jgi:hypothetical protein